MPPPPSPDGDDAAVTLADVARAADVNPSTVSRVLNQPGRINERTAERVRAAADRLGYRPNRAARRLAGGRTGAIGLLVADLGNPFFAGVARAVQQRAQDAGALTFVADADGSADTEIDLISTLGPNVDGLILCAPTAPTRQLRAALADRPAVLVNRQARGLPSIVADQARAVTLAADHLRGLGHERVGHLGGPPDKWVAAGRGRVATRLGLVALGPVSADFGGGAAAATRVVESGCTAVVAHNDLVAIGLIDRLSATGIDVPDEISVVGCDDIGAATLTRPRLTSVAMPLEGLGRRATEVLLELTGPDGAEARAPQVQLDVELVVRDSTGPPRSAS